MTLQTLSATELRTQPIYRIEYGVRNPLVITNSSFAGANKELSVKLIRVVNDKQEPYAKATVIMVDANAEYPGKMKSLSIRDNNIVIKMGYGSSTKVLFTGFVSNANLQYHPETGFETRIECASYEKKLVQDFGKHDDQSRKLYTRSYESGTNQNNSPSFIASLLAEQLINKGLFPSSYNSSTWYDRAESSRVKDWKKMSYHFSLDLNYLQIIHTLALLNNSVLLIPTNSERFYGQYMHLMERRRWFPRLASDLATKVGTIIVIGQNIRQMEFRYNDEHDVINHVTVEGGIDESDPSSKIVAATYTINIPDFGKEPRKMTYQTAIPFGTCLEDLAEEICSYTAINPNRVELWCDGLPTIDPKPNPSDMNTIRYDVFKLSAPIPTRLFPNMSVQGGSKATMVKNLAIKGNPKVMKMVNGIFYVESVMHQFDSNGFVSFIRGSQYFTNPLLIDYFTTGMVGVGFQKQKCHPIIMLATVKAIKSKVSPIAIEVNFGSADEDFIVSMAVPFVAVERGIIALPKVGESVIIAFPDGINGYIIGSIFHGQYKDLPEGLDENEIRIGNVAIKIDGSGNVYLGDKDGTKALAFKDHVHTLTFTPPNVTIGVTPLTATVSEADKYTTKVQAK